MRCAASWKNVNQKMSMFGNPGMYRPRTDYFNLMGWTSFYDTAPLEAVAQQYRAMPDDFIAASGTDVTEPFLRYARPLIGEPLPAVLSFV